MKTENCYIFSLTMQNSVARGKLLGDGRENFNEKSLASIKSHLKGLSPSCPTTLPSLSRWATSLFRWHECWQRVL